MKAFATNQNRHAIILAGGDGARLSETRRISGDCTPKQFCPVIGDTSLLDQTRLRVALAVDENRIFTVLNGAGAEIAGTFKPLYNRAPREKMLLADRDRGRAARWRSAQT
jgi:mannose-1-phosphate guanylyltransferase